MGGTPVNDGKNDFAGPDGKALPRLLIVDDDRDMLEMLALVIGRKCSCAIKLAESGEEAAAIMETWRPDVVLSDIKMPGMDGLALLEQAKALDPAMSVIMMTGHGTVDLAVSALKQGAYDFYEKPFDNDLVVRAVQRSFERAFLRRENRRLQARLREAGGGFHGLIGESPRLRAVAELIQRVADTDVTVLIRGESGTGKELAARAIHEASPRAGRPLVTVNCPALPEPILESELFGYTRGAFTGAVQEKRGLFLEAQKSTILLDEIGDMPVALQTKLLRVLQEKEIQPLGQTRTIPIDVRILASTNQDIEAKIKEGLFREDLFYRLNVVTITMPPLRDRPEDIPLLAHHFLTTFARKYQRAITGFTPEALSCLCRNPWPGNVRQLQNTVKRAVLLATGERIAPEDLRCDMARKDVGAPPGAELRHLPYYEAKRQLVTDFSRDYFDTLLRQHDGNVSAAARAAGLGRQALQRLLKNFGLRPGDYRHS